MTDIVEKKTRGPRKARNRLQEMTFAGKAFVKAIDGYASVAAAKYAISDSSDLAELLASMSDATEAARGAHKAFEPHFMAMKREADLIRENAEKDAMLRSMAEALRTSGHSDKIPDALKVAPAPAKAAPINAPTGARPRGRPPKLASVPAQQPANAA